MHDLGSGTTTRVSVSSAGVQGDRRSLAPAIATDGRAVVFLSSARNLTSGDTNGLPDIFVRGPLA